MANLIRLARFRAVSRRDLPLDIPEGDSDLRAVAVLLWAASFLRTGLTLLHNEAFGVESTLALLCAVLLPLFALRADTRAIPHSNNRPRLVLRNHKNGVLRGR